MKVNLSTEKLEYFNLKIVDNVNINYDISSYPTCEISVVCTEQQKEELEEKIDSDLLPLFLGYFKPESISFIEDPFYLNLGGIYRASISFKYFLNDNLEASFNLTPQGIYKDFTKPNERGVLTSTIKNITLEAPIQNYRFIDVRQNVNLLTTANTEINYLMNTYGLIINQKRLRKGIIELIPYGKKISEITIPSNEIFDRQTTALTNLNYQIAPTIIWKNSLTFNQNSLLDGVTNATFTTTCFDFTDLTDSQNTDFNITLSDGEFSPYNSLNPFTRNYENPPLSETNLGIKELDKVNHNDYFFLTDFRKYNNDFLDAFSENLNLNFNRTSLRGTRQTGTFTEFNVNKPLLNTSVDFNIPEFGTTFTVRNINQEVLLESGEDGQENEDEKVNIKGFTHLATNNGRTKTRTVQKLKNGQLLWTETRQYGYKYLSFSDSVVSASWEVVSYQKETINYKVFQYNGWQEKYYTKSGHLTTGWRYSQLKPPSIEAEEKLEDYYASTIGNTDPETATYYELLFKVTKLPFTEELVNEFTEITFLPEYKGKTDTTEQPRYPLEYVVKSVRTEDSRALQEIDGKVFTVGFLKKDTSTIDFTYISSDIEVQPHIYRETKTSLSMESVGGKLGNRIKQTSFTESTDVSSLLVGYTQIENPYASSSRLPTREELLIFTKNQSTMYNAKIENIYSDSALPVKNKEDAIRTFLSLRHLELIKSNYNKTITVLGNANIYPADTIKYRWNNKTEGGLVLSVQHNLQILPNNLCRWITTITFSDYSFTDFKAKFETRSRNLYV
jgi:hypothetical protein